MKLQNLQKSPRTHRCCRPTVLLALLFALAAGAAATGWAEAVYVVTGLDDGAIVLDGAGEAPDLSSKILHITSGTKGYDVNLSSGRPVTVRHGDEVYTAKSKRETVSTLLKRLGVVPSPLEGVAVDVTDAGLTITVAEEITYYETLTEEAPYDTVRVANPEMKKGEEKVIQEGKDGVRTSIYEITWSNGTQMSRQFVEELDSTAVDKIVEYGTAAAPAAAAAEQSPIASVSKNADGSGVLTLKSGTTLRFSSAKTMTATAYTAGYDGADYTTATGTFVRVGTVAVDKKVIPLGTRMYIVTNDGIVYGMAVAEDTGVRGNKVDLYYDTYQQCINFGRRSCTVYILE
ncbi:G5 and 3D domain-containing protein [uncultured Dysosmobacter sp.]|uniref:G5 and 3D domain-containing protein n=1 Tax=uncultured Dysosmobacter sp. TaxID=2591384 RepID=UPI0026263EAB|nr:G5 domain-containing protein [uncultured Dysosmobacter sp.]